MKRHTATGTNYRITLALVCNDSAVHPSHCSLPGCLSAKDLRAAYPTGGGEPEIETGIYGKLAASLLPVALSIVLEAEEALRLEEWVRALIGTGMGWLPVPVLLTTPTGALENHGKALVALALLLHGGSGAATTPTGTVCTARVGGISSTAAAEEVREGGAEGWRSDLPVE